MGGHRCCHAMQGGRGQCSREGYYAKTQCQLHAYLGLHQGQSGGRQMRGCGSGQVSSLEDWCISHQQAERRFSSEFFRARCAQLMVLDDGRLVGGELVSQLRGHVHPWTFHLSLWPTSVYLFSEFQGTSLTVS